MGVVSGREEKERAAFERDMSVHVAQLMGFAKPYTARLPKRELTKFLSLTLDLAWQNRRMLGTTHALLPWWGLMLRRAALLSETWTQVYSHKTITVSGRELGKADNS